MLATHAEEDASPTIKATSGSSSAAAHSRKTSSGSRITPPVLNKNDPNLATRRRSSSIVEKDGSVEMATLDGSSRRKGSGSEAPDGKADPGLSSFLNYSMGAPAATQTASSVAPLASYGMLDPNYSMAPRRAAPSDLDIEKANAPHDDAGSISQHSPSDSSYTAGNGPSTLSTRGSSAPLNGSFARGSGDSSTSGRRISPTTTTKRPVTAEAAAAATPAPTRPPPQARRSPQPPPCLCRGSAVHLGHLSDSDDSDDVEFRRMRPRKDAGDFDMISPPVEHLKHHRVPPTARNYPRMADILAMDEREMSRARNGGGGFSGERRGSAVQILPGEVMVDMPSKEAFEESLGDDWKWGMNVTAGSGRHPNKHSRKSGNTRASSGNIHGRTDETGVATGTSSTSSIDENGVDSIGSTLNRQASLLLLLYPAAYCILFSFSIARCRWIWRTRVRRCETHTTGCTRSVRWLIFAQGAIDAVIFQLSSGNLDRG